MHGRRRRTVRIVPVWVADVECWWGGDAQPPGRFVPQGSPRCEIHRRSLVIEDDDEVPVAVSVREPDGLVEGFSRPLSNPPEVLFRGDVNIVAGPGIRDVSVVDYPHLPPGTTSGTKIIPPLHEPLQTSPEQL